MSRAHPRNIRTMYRPAKRMKLREGSSMTLNGALRAAITKVNTGQAVFAQICDKSTGLLICEVSRGRNLKSGLLALQILYATRKQYV